MATIYRSTDTGAPALPPAGNYNQAGFIMDLLKACLVEGYGSKQPAGWEIDYEDTTTDKRRIAFSNGNGVIEFVSWGTSSVGMFIWDSITTPGSGRIYDDPWSTVVSEGVNGWKDERTPAPGAETEYMMGLYIHSLNQASASEYAWTVYADEKSAWMIFHKPEGHSDTEPGDYITTATGAYHPNMFFGAVKSSDLPRSAPGNFFVCFGGRGIATSGAATAGSQSTLNYMWGLRTPMNTLPSDGANSDYEIDGYECSAYTRNPYSSARILLPVVASYNGSDVPKPAGLSPSYGEYHFAALPGVAQIGKGDGSQTHFWSLHNQERGATWSLQPTVIDGSTWMPWKLGRPFLNEVGITDDPAWW